MSESRSRLSGDNLLLRGQETINACDGVFCHDTLVSEVMTHALDKLDLLFGVEAGDCCLEY